MAEIDQNIIIDISKTISAIDERTKALQNADVQAQIQADHRHRGIMQVIENFVPRREIESMNSSTRAYADQLAKDTRDNCDVNREAVIARVDKIDKTVESFSATGKKLVAWFLGVIGTAIVGGIGYLASHMMHLQFAWQN